MCDKADDITRFVYGGDWLGNNNWNNLARYAVPAYVYSSVVETQTHYYANFTPARLASTPLTVSRGRQTASRWWR